MADGLAQLIAQQTRGGGIRNDALNDSLQFHESPSCKPQGPVYETTQLTVIDRFCLPRGIRVVMKPIRKLS